jgi:hypothetical protein
MGVEPPGEGPRPPRTAPRMAADALRPRGDGTGHAVRSRPALAQDRCAGPLPVHRGDGRPLRGTNDSACGQAATADYALPSVDRIGASCGMSGTGGGWNAAGSHPHFSGEGCGSVCLAGCREREGDGMRQGAIRIFSKRDADRQMASGAHGSRRFNPPDARSVEACLRSAIAVSGVERGCRAIRSADQPAGSGCGWSGAAARAWPMRVRSASESAGRPGRGRRRTPGTGAARDPSTASRGRDPRTPSRTSRAPVPRASARCRRVPWRGGR